MPLLHVSLYKCTVTLRVFSPCVKNIPMSMTLCFTVGWRACQWFQKRSCISGLLSFSNTAITTVWSGERNMTEKQRISYIARLNVSLSPASTSKNSPFRAITFHLSLQIPLFSSHCHQLFAVSRRVFVYIPILWFAWQRKGLSPMF